VKTYLLFVVLIWRCESWSASTNK